MSNTFTQHLRTLLLALILSIGISYAYATWSDPTGTPPNNNASAPINISSAPQVKSGALGVDDLFTAYKDVILAKNSGNVGIGDATPDGTLKLDVEGQVGATQYCDENGANCTAATALGGGIVSGVMQMYGGSTPPSGWLLCNGAAVSRATYATLFSVIGTTFGAGDGATTFNLPDMRGRSPIGAGQGAGLTDRTLGITGGEENHTLTIVEMPAHTHSVAGSSGGTTVNDTQHADVVANGGTTGSTGGGSAHNVMSPFLATNCIIKE